MTPNTLRRPPHPPLAASHAENRSDCDAASGAIASVIASLLLAAMLCCAPGCAGSDPAARQQLQAGYTDLSEHRYDQALAASDAFLQKTPTGPGSAEALYLRGRVFEARAADAEGDPEQARADLQLAGDAYARALQQQQSAPPPVAGLAHAGLANAAYHLDDYATAAREWPLAYPLLALPEAKAWTLYRTGVSLQRLGQFAPADEAFAEVQKTYPGGEPAARATAHMGARAFFLQVGAFASPTSADKEIAALKLELRVERLDATRGTDPNTGRQIVRIGPIGTYGQAKALQARLARRYPDAMILP